MATRTLVLKRQKNMRIEVSGVLGVGVTAKDIALAVIGKIGTAGGSGHVIEFTGSAIRALTMEGRMTLCNMSIEAGARSGLIAPDQVTFDYVMGRPQSPKGAAFEQAVAYWKTLISDDGAHYDKEIFLKAEGIIPQVTWGTSPEHVLPITGVVPAAGGDPRIARALDYIGLTPGTKLQDIAIDRVFIGSCTNGRIEDIRAAAAVVRGRKVNKNVVAWVVPGSGLVRLQAEEEGLDRILIRAGFDWREPGCSMCLAMNADKLEPGERCAATSNRNFEGRQGKGGRTHLMSPAMAAAAAITGHITDVREL